MVTVAAALVTTLTMHNATRNPKQQGNINRRCLLGPLTIFCMLADGLKETTL
jgi:hypothetical protein